MNATRNDDLLRDAAGWQSRSGFGQRVQSWACEVLGNPRLVPEALVWRMPMVGARQLPHGCDLEGYGREGLEGPIHSYAAEVLNPGHETLHHTY